MPKDHRLDLGRYITNPFDTAGFAHKKLSFGDLFRAKADDQSSPFAPSRFDERDLLNAVKARQITLNPDLNYVRNSPYFADTKNPQPSDYELFEGLGRFNRKSYDFKNGRPLTKKRPEDQPDFQPLWMEAYRFSPTIEPGKRAKNPCPTLTNPDPNNNLLTMAQQRAENEFEGNLSVKDLLPAARKQKALPADQKEGTKVVDKQESEPKSDSNQTA